MQCTSPMRVFPLLLVSVVAGCSSSSAPVGVDPTEVGDGNGGGKADGDKQHEV